MAALKKTCFELILPWLPEIFFFSQVGEGCFGVGRRPKPRNYEWRCSFLNPCPDIKKTLCCIKINWKNRQLSISDQSLFRPYGIILQIFYLRCLDTVFWRDHYRYFSIALKVPYLCHWLMMKFSPTIDYGLKFVKM